MPVLENYIHLSAYNSESVRHCMVGKEGKTHICEARQEATSY